MSKSRFPPDLDLDGIAPDEAFSILGNETRLDIVRVLWQAGAANEYDELVEDAETMSFSELRRAVGIEDNGKFNYHLSQLVGHFVTENDDGYRLSGAGKRIARTVIAVSGGEDLEMRSDLDRDCPLCGAAMTASYEDQWLRVECTECDGMFGDETPEGTVYFSNYPAAGLSERTTDEAVSTGLYRCMLDQAYMMRGVCRECAGPIATSASVCEDHDPANGTCEACGTAFPVWTEQRCETCGFAKRLPVEVYVTGLTPVIGFLDDQGVDVLSPSFEEMVDLFDDAFETTVGGDALCTVSIHGDDDTLRVSMDDELDAVEIERGA